MSFFEKKTLTFFRHSRFLTRYLRWSLIYPGEKLTPCVHLQLTMLFTFNYTAERKLKCEGGQIILWCKLWLRRAQSSVSRLSQPTEMMQCRTKVSLVLKPRKGRPPKWVTILCVLCFLYCCQIMYVFCYCQYPLLLLSLDRSSLSSLHCTGQEALTRECLCPCPDNSGSYHSLPLYVNEINVNINWPRFIFWRFSFCMKVYIGEGLSSSKKLRHRQLSLGKFSFCFFFQE